MGFAEASYLTVGTHKLKKSVLYDSNGNALNPAAPVLGAGSAVVGKVGIDQTTPGTTNGVVANASENLIGLVGSPNDLILVTPTLSVAGSYSTGDYIGQTTTPEAFVNANRTSGGKAVLKSIVITDKVTTAAVALELWLFSATFTAPTDNAAWAITDAHALLCQGVIAIETGRWYASSNNKVYSDDRLGLVVNPAVRSLFFALVARGTTPTWAAGDLQIGLGFLQA